MTRDERRFLAMVRASLLDALSELALEANLPESDEDARYPVAGASSLIIPATWTGARMAWTAGGPNVLDVRTRGLSHLWTALGRPVADPSAPGLPALIERMIKILWPFYRGVSAQHFQGSTEYLITARAPQRVPQRPRAIAGRGRALIPNQLDKLSAAAADLEILLDGALYDQAMTGDESETLYDGDGKHAVVTRVLITNGLRSEGGRRLYAFAARFRIDSGDGDWPILLTERDDAPSASGPVEFTPKFLLLRTDHLPDPDPAVLASYDGDELAYWEDANTYAELGFHIPTADDLFYAFTSSHARPPSLDTPWREYGYSLSGVLGALLRWP